MTLEEKYKTLLDFVKIIGVSSKSDKEIEERYWVIDSMEILKLARTILRKIGELEC